MSVALDLAELIETKVSDLKLGKNLFIGHEPESPQNCVTLYDTGGLEQNPKLAYDNLFVQIRSRNKNYGQGYNLLDTIRRHIEGGIEQVVNGSNYLGFYTETAIAFLERDVNARSIFTVNMRVTVEPSEDKIGNRQLIGDS